MIEPNTKVMVAGVGGASLGTEICKALRLAGRYSVYGCDVSPTAYGLYEGHCVETFRVRREAYVEDVVRVCRESGARWLIPGGEQPMTLLGAVAGELAANGIVLLANDPAVIAEFSDKQRTFERLASAGFSIPRTAVLGVAADLDRVGLPCIVKPATGSGGSASVFFATSAEEALVYAEFIRRGGSTPIAQEYVDAAEGEFTIGVLSLPNGAVVGSIALRRALDAKLSVSYRGRGGLVSSGYSQGYIDEFPELCRQAEALAVAIGSRGPINVQCRVRKGEMLPFEINPRFSASTYLRAMAGFNEVDLLLRYLAFGEAPTRAAIKPGWYLRSLTERFVAQAELK